MNKEELSKTRAKEYSDSGMSKYFKKDYRGAIKDFNQALRFNPNDAEAYGNRSIARHKIGDRRKAIEDCKFAAVLYSRQGNIKQHQYALKMQKRLLQSA